MSTGRRRLNTVSVRRPLLIWACRWLARADVANGRGGRRRELAGRRQACESSVQQQQGGLRGFRRKVRSAIAAPMWTASDTSTSGDLLQVQLKDFAQLLDRTPAACELVCVWICFLFGSCRCLACIQWMVPSHYQRNQKTYMLVTTRVITQQKLITETWKCTNSAELWSDVESCEQWAVWHMGYKCAPNKLLAGSCRTASSNLVLPGFLR